MLKSNDQLRDEAQILRRQHGEMQTQLDELRDRLGPLDRSLQELLYQPAVQSADQTVANKLFAIFDMVVEMKTSLGSGSGRK